MVIVVAQYAHAMIVNPLVTLPRKILHFIMVMHVFGSQGIRLDMVVKQKVFNNGCEGGIEKLTVLNRKSVLKNSTRILWSILS
jgi:hypothetical protein